MLYCVYNINWLKSDQFQYTISVIDKAYYIMWTCLRLKYAYTSLLLTLSIKHVFWENVCSRNQYNINTYTIYFDYSAMIYSFSNGILHIVLWNYISTTSMYILLHMRSKQHQIYRIYKHNSYFNILLYTWHGYIPTYEYMP